MQDIIINKLCKAYGDKTVLKDFSCCFSAGTAVCLTAPSGYGKTTLLRILMGLERADSGSVSGMEGVCVCALFQEDRLCENLSAEANLRLVNPRLSREDAGRLLEEAGLSGFTDRPVCEFSGGMKRRAALMRALCMPGELLVLDEPFKGLDADSRHRMISCIQKYRSGRTLILVSHNPADVQDLQAQPVFMEELNHI